MFNILIADDEVVERQALKMIIESGVPGARVIGEAANGRMAIQLAADLKPDVVMMDIKMPGIDGIEAVRRIKEAHPRIKFIMVSAFDTFEYARQVMQQGVKEYLLKPARKEEIVQAVERTLAEIQTERETQAEQVRLREKLEQALSLIQSEWVIHLFMDHMREKSLREWGEMLDIRVDRGYAIVFSFAKRKPDWPEQEKARLYEELKENLDKKLANGYLVAPMLGSNVPVLIMTSEWQQANIMQTIREVVEAFQRERPDVPLYAGIGTSQSAVEHFPRSYQEALHALEQTTPDQPVCFYRASSQGKADKAAPFEKEKKLLELIKWGDVQEAVNQFESYFAETVRTMGHNRKKLKQTFTEFFVLVAYLLKEINMEVEADIRFDESDSIPAIREQAIWQLKQLVERVKNWRLLHAKDLMHKAKEYIDEHYAQAVSLEDVAAHVRLSPYHFSKLFKERFHVTFTDYLTGVRIEKAKELILQPDYSLKEICYHVGYKDPNYFSRVFKKITGVSPREYRRNLIPPPQR